jgi:uncharacterized damage-inducible protein DinB
MNAMLAEMFRHNLWANLRLIDACVALPESVLEAHVPGTYGTVRETIGHLAGTEEGYLAMLTGALAPGALPRDATATPDLATLREHALRAGQQLDLATVRDHLRASGKGLIAYAASVEGDPTVQVAWPDQVYELPASLVLAQAINHATEHRSRSTRR